MTSIKDFNRVSIAAVIAASLSGPVAALAQDGGAVEQEGIIRSSADALTPAEPDDHKVVDRQLTDPPFKQSWLEEQGSPVDFDNFWLLFGLIPTGIALWTALRSEPLKPFMIDFAPLFLLRELETPEHQPNQMPVWEKMNWMGALGLSFLAAAGPHINDQLSFTADGPVLIAVDTGWASAASKGYA